jgi:hypothetical protein
MPRARHKHEVFAWGRQPAFLSNTRARDVAQRSSRRPDCISHDASCGDFAIVTRIIGFTIGAAGVLITFLPVSGHAYFDGRYHGECGSVSHATFANWNNYPELCMRLGRHPAPPLGVPSH